MHKVIILQARLGSQRFPQKVIADLAGQPVIAHIVDRLRCSKLADEICVAIPDSSADQPLADALAKIDVTLVRGSEHDVLGRFIQAAYQTKATVIVRATADNVLVDPGCLDAMLEAIEADSELDYLITDGLPSGITTEVFTLKTLEKLDYLAKHPDMREHVTLYLRQHPGPFVVKHLAATGELKRPELHLSLDTQSDYKLFSAIYTKLYQPGKIIAVADAIKLVDEDRELGKLARPAVAVSAAS